jgi:hypothetical protein
MAQLSIQKHPGKKNLNNSGTSELSVIREINSIKPHPDFENLFSRKPHVLELLKTSMGKNGFDKSKPLDLWKEQNALIDGYSRLQAAKEVGLREVYIYEHSFKSIDEAMEYALGVQIARRNLNDAELMVAVEKLDMLKGKGRKKAGTEDDKGRTSDKLAEKLGTNSRKIEKVRAIEKQADKEIIEDVKGGKLSINAAYNKMKSKNNPLPEPRDENSTNPYDFDLEPIDPGGDRRLERMLEGVDSQTLKFLKAAVIVLLEKKLEGAARILVNHFLRKKERQSFYLIFPKLKETEDF